jgi:hypothetical protein
MLLPVTGSSGGNRKSTVVNDIYARAIRLTIQPRACGKTNDLSGIICLPLRQFIAIGIPYATSSMTTDEDVMALNALQGVIASKMYQTKHLP